MKKTFIIFLAIFAIGVSLAFAEDATVVPKTDVPSQEINTLGDKNIDKDGVAFSLIYKGLGLVRGPWFTPRLVVWNDGRVLIGQGEEKDRADWEYYFGKVDPKTIREMQEHIRTSFRIAGANQNIGDFGPESYYYHLQVYSDGGEISIATWEHFWSTGPNSVKLKAEDAIDGKPMLLSEFYDIWKKVKADVLQLGETAVAQKGVPVNVVIGERSTFVVKDKADKVLAEYPAKTTLVVKIESITTVQSNLLPPKNWRVEASVVRRTGGISPVKPGEKVSFLIHSPTQTFAKPNAQVIGKEFKIRYESDFTRENYAGELQVVAVD